MRYMTEPRHRGNHPGRPRRNDIFEERQRLEQDIQAGMDLPVSGTGRPMDELYGGAKINARLSNIGGGAKANGGGGIEQGLMNLFGLADISARCDMVELISRRDDTDPPMPRLR